MRDLPENQACDQARRAGGAVVSRRVTRRAFLASGAAAAARLALIDAAAKSWDVSPADCVAERGMIRHMPTGRSLRYGEIVAKVPITKTFTEDELKQITLKKPADYRVVGQWIPRLDIPDKVTGKAKFGMDTFLPNMVYAKVAYPPVREGATRTAVDDSGAKRVQVH